jgi:predicted alpha/beta superfamily hydrolase
VNISRYGNPDADIVLIQPVDDHDLAGIENEVAKIQRLTDQDFCLIAIRVGNWNTDLSPWKAPAAFGKEDFGGGADRTLTEVLKYTEDPAKTYYIGGYSLAALFAVWAVYQTDVFRGAAAASPSVWFPGFAEYMKENRIRTGSVYLSLGDREEKTRNPVMATVGDRIREAHDLLKEQGVNTILEWNPGNHFRDADLRCAKGLAWAVNRLSDG